MTKRILYLVAFHRFHTKFVKPLNIAIAEGHFFGGTQQATCAILNSDQLFATGQYRVSAGNRKRLQDFFAKVPAKSFIISGYTDSRGGQAANLRLSQKRADAVARIARAAGVEITAVRGYGESYAKASNATPSGRAQNRRVEIVCMY